MTIEESFEIALSYWLTIKPDKEGAPDLSMGKFTIDGNDPLVLQLSQSVSDNSDLLPFLDFQKLLLSTPEKPVAPKLGDPVFDPPNISYNSPLEQKVAAVYRFKQAEQDYEKRYARYQEIFERPRALVSGYRSNPDGYLDYVRSTLSDDSQGDPNSFFFKPRAFHIAEDVRRKHTFIAAGTGSGKSELIKFLIRHYETVNKNTAVILIDPHGPLAKDVALYSEHLDNDRLVYIDVRLSPGHHAVFNAFEVKDKSEQSLEIQSEHLVAAFEQIVGGFSENMEALLIPCLTLLLHKDGSDLSDIIPLLDNKRNQDLIRYGQTQLPYEEHRKFFKYGFFSNNYDSSKDALNNRFQSLLSIPTIKRFTCGPSTFDLEDLIEQKKIIVFNLPRSKVSKKAIKVIGQFITAYVQGYTMRRQDIPNNPMTPVHFFVDECQYFISSTTEEILGESRKFELYLTLATQRTKQVGNDLLDTILGNVACFFVGKSKGQTLSKMSDQLDIDKTEIKNLAVGNFYVSQESKLPTKTKLPEVGQKFAMTKKQWETVKAEQLKRYYKPIENNFEREHQSPKQSSSKPRHKKPGIVFPGAPPKPNPKP